jgi:hypothetical protein
MQAKSDRGPSSGRSTLSKQRSVAEPAAVAAYLPPIKPAGRRLLSCFGKAQWCAVGTASATTPALRAVLPRSSVCYADFFIGDANSIIFPR